MKTSFLAGPVVLVLGLLTSAWAQPFADAPTTYWAHGALAKLAADGLIQDYRWHVPRRSNAYAL
ncbi:MAG TPA: hypothetical protein VKV57_11925 [bacterium]|nr:hypothetical protein [bacterium]